MRLLIDGYNVMHAAGLMARRFGPDGLRRTRHRFLNDLVDGVGPDRVAQTTVVFDAQRLPISQSAETTHKGLRVVYAIDEDEADDRIEGLIERHSAPKSLTVVSSDRRLRRAATRRRATSQSAIEFLDELDALRTSKATRGPVTPSAAERARLEGPTIEEAEAWAREFGARIDLVEFEAEAAADLPAWTDEDLLRVALEVAEEDGGLGGIARHRRRR